MRAVLVIVIVLFFSQQGFAGGVPHGEAKDTVPAYTMYGKTFLLKDVENFDLISIREYRDSLHAKGAPRSVIDQIEMYISIASKSDEQVVAMIDSLFELPEIPFSLVNQINFYVATHSKIEQEMIPVTDTSFYPAQCFYNSWNTQKAFNPDPKLSKHDSTLKLVLAGIGKSTDFVMPVQNTLTSKFGWRDGRPHKGIDLDLEVWDPVVSAFPGMVRMARFYGGYGRVVVIRHYNGLETLYAHLHRLKVKPGQIVEAGELIGLGGSSGHSTGSHLHFECRFKGIPINPLSFIEYKTEELISDTLILKKTSYGYASFPEGTRFYTVKAGDCLYDIAKAFGTTTYNIAELNGIRRNSILRVGQSLRVI